MVRFGSVLLLSLAACAGRTSPGASDDVTADPGFVPSDPAVPPPTSSAEVGGAPWVPAGDAPVAVADGSSFNLMGQAFDGPLAGTQLGRLPGMTAFWFAWSTHHPGARVWQADGPDRVNQEGWTPPATDCGVPCEEIINGCFGGKDCIPSIDDPVWVTADSTSGLAYLTDDDRVIGLTLSGGRARAYPLDTLWTHEVVNDVVDGWPFSVTYCPLTGSGIVVDGVQDGAVMRFGVSGRLYNANLVLYDRATDSLYGQMRQVGFRGERFGEALAVHAAVDTTWGQWRAMFPDTEVLSSDVGVSAYPYGDYRTNDGDTFVTNNPTPEPWYPNKSYAIGVVGETETVVYPFAELQAALGAGGFVTDTLDDVPVVVGFHAASQTATVHSRVVDGETLTLE